MKRHLPFFVVVCLLSTVSAFARGGFSKTQDFRPATPEELAMTSVPDAPGAEAAILDWVRIDDDPESTSSEYFRIKIFTEEGKKHADVELSYVPAYPVFGRITDVSARTIRPDGSIVPFNGKLYDKTIVKVGRASLKAKTFSLSDVQAGSIIEYRYIRRWTPSLLFNTQWSVQRDIPILHSKFTLVPYAEGDYSSFFTYFGLPAGVAPARAGRDRFELELTNMPALRSEAFAPPEEQLRARVDFAYTSSSVKPEEFWNVQPKVFAKQAESFIGRSKTAGELARKLSAGEADREILLQKIYAHVQGLRNLSFESMKSEQEVKRENIRESRNVEEVLRRGAGFSTELSRAFVAIARAAGFDADAMRVAPRDRMFFSAKFPDAEQMSGEVAIVFTDGKALFLDPGTPHAPYGTVSWEKTNVPSIRLSKDSKFAWTQVPSHEPVHAITRRTAELRLKDETLEGTVTVSFEGQQALVRRLGMIEEDEAARKKALEDEVKAWFPDGATLTLRSITGDRSSDPALVVSYDVILPNAVSRAGSRVVVPLSIFESKAKNPFAPAARTHVIYFPYPTREEDQVKLILPETLQVATVPKPSVMDIGAVSYRAETKRQGNEVTFTRATNVTTTFVDTKHYAALRNFFSAMTAADQQSLVLTPGAAN